MIWKAQQSSARALLLLMPASTLVASWSSAEWAESARTFFSAGPWADIVTRISTAELEAAQVLREENVTRLDKFFHKLTGDGAKHSCCVRVLVIGGSTTCGMGQKPTAEEIKKMDAKPTPPGVEPAGGPNNSYSANLERWLEAARGACCPEGHSVENLCEGGASAQYFVQTFATHVAAAHTRQPADLVLIDTASNDFNSWFFYKLASRSYRTHSAKIHADNTIVYEALVRFVFGLHPRPAIFALQTAWFEPDVKEGKGLARAERWGAWTDHEPVLRHYSIPTMHTAFAFNDNLTRRLPFYIDANHMSAGGHWATAYMLARTLGTLWQRQSSERLARADDGLPPALKLPTDGSAEAPQSTIDFTDANASFRSHIKDASSGWRWLCSFKQPNGTYAIVDAAERPHCPGGKVLYTARSSKPEFFVAEVRIRKGALHVGHLRSYEGQADALVEVLDYPAIPSSSPLYNAHNATKVQWVANGTWEQRMSTYDNSRFQVPQAMLAFRKVWPVSLLRSNGYCWTARIKVTLLPRQLRPTERGAGGERGGWGAFSLFVITSY